MDSRKPPVLRPPNKAEPLQRSRVGSRVAQLGVVLGALVAGIALFVLLVGDVPGHGGVPAGTGQTIGWGLQLIILSLIYDRLSQLVEQSSE